MKCIITDLNSVCNDCGFFNAESPVNNGYGCKHPYNDDGEFLDNKGYVIKYPEDIIAKSFTKRKISCNRRLAKKFIKKTRKLSFYEQKKHLKKLGINFYSKCYSFSCPIAWEIDFEELKNYQNSNEFSHIENEKEMPWGFGDDLMGMEKKQADSLGINY